MADTEAPFAKPGIPAAELGVYIKQMDATIFSRPMSEGIRREVALGILNMLATRSRDVESGSAPEDVLGDLNPDQAQALGRIINLSGITESAPTNRERAEAAIFARELS
jgi:hypothetical protein